MDTENSMEGEIKQRESLKENVKKEQFFSESEGYTYISGVHSEGGGLWKLKPREVTLGQGRYGKVARHLSDELVWMYDEMGS